MHSCIFMMHSMLVHSGQQILSLAAGKTVPENTVQLLTITDCY